MSDFSTALIAALEAAEVSLSRPTDTSVTARVFPGIRGVQTEVPLTWPDAAPGDSYDAADLDHRIAVASYARGIAAALAEPRRSKAEDMPFTDAARTILPSIEGPLFAAGVELVGGGTPFLTPFGDNLTVAYAIELDLGIRTLREAQVAAWGTTADRVSKAAMSILFHRSWGLDFASVEDTPFDAFDGRDGLDAARVLMLDQSHYDRVRDGLLFAVPNDETLLVSQDTSDASAMALAAHAREACEASALPLSPSVFAFERGRRLPEPRRR